MKHYNLFLSLGALFLLSTACIQEEFTDIASKQEGQTIVFSVSTSYDNGGIETKAEYSGDLIGSSPSKERIDWVENDPIKIYYNNTAGSYSVVDKTTVQEKSYAGVDGGKLTWGVGPSHVFYGLYPSGSDSAAGSLTIENGAAIVRGSIPSNQSVNPEKTIVVGDLTKYQPDTEHYGYMFAYKSLDAPVDNVELPFKPAFTTLEFKLKRKPGDADKKVEMIWIDAHEVYYVGDENEIQIIDGAWPTLAGDFEFAIPANNGEPTLPGTAPYYETDPWHWPTVTEYETDGNIKVSNFSFEIYLDFSTFDGGGVSIPADSYMDFSVLMLPVDQTHLRLHLFYTDGTEKQLSLKDKDNDDWYTFSGGKKYIITCENVPGENVPTYVLEHAGPTVMLSDGSTEVQVVTRPSREAGNTDTAPFNSYRTFEGVTTPVNVYYDYAGADENGDPLTDTDGNIIWSSGLPTDLSSVTVTGTTVNKSLYATVATNTNPTVESFQSEEMYRARKIQMNGNNGFSASSPQDLSLYDITDLTHPRASSLPTTANCYVVDRAGWYMFPLVYGNSIDYSKPNAPLYENGVNKFSYQIAEPVSYALSVLKNGYNNAITSPYILDDYNISFEDVEAVILSEDETSSDYAFLDQAEVINVPSSGIFYDPVAGEYKTSVPYIRFRAPDTVLFTADGEVTTDPAQAVHAKGAHQGNAVIAIRKKNQTQTTKTVLWSWHIWITDGYDIDGDHFGDGLDPIPLKTNPNFSSVTTSNNVMPVNLGWIDSGGPVTFKDRVWYVRVHQVDDTAPPIVFKVVQHSQDERLPGSGTFYEWGRKDPFLPAVFYISNTYRVSYKDRSFYSPAGYSTYQMYRVGNVSWTGDISTSILCPYWWPYLPSDGYSWSHTRSINLWNMGANNDTWDQHIYKTIYDPCPPRYCVPHFYAFAGFSELRNNGVPASNYNSWNKTWSPGNQAQDRNEDGYLTSDDYYKEGGWYFNTGYEGQSLFLPMTGHRHFVNGGLWDCYRMNYASSGGWYWLGIISSSGSLAGCSSITDHNIWPAVINQNDVASWESQGYAVRAVEELSY